MAEIHKKIGKLSERNVFSRVFRVGDDKKRIDVWTSDLQRIRLIFNVCFVSSVRSSITVHFQAELLTESRHEPGDEGHATVALNISHPATPRSRPFSNSHRSLGGARREPADATDGLRPPNAVKSLAREIERERVYGSGRIYTSQSSLMTTAAVNGDSEYDIFPQVRISPAFFARLCGLQVLSNNSNAHLRMPTLMRSMFWRLRCQG